MRGLVGQWNDHFIRDEKDGSSNLPQSTESLGALKVE